MGKRKGVVGTGRRGQGQGQTKRRNNNGGQPPDNHPHHHHHHHYHRDDLYVELWRHCAGPLVCIPSEGDTVVYFPQGHLEAVEPYCDQDGNVEMPRYNVPSKILCKVVNVQLQAEEGTDMVFAHITLLPEAEQNKLRSIDDDNSRFSPQKTYAQFFCKPLTESDTSSHGGFSVRKRDADECLPHLDLNQLQPKQDLLAKDLQGREWHFRHTYRGQPRRHLLTTGWSKFVSAKKLVAGDAFILLRGRNGELRVGLRRAMKLQKKTPTNIISGQSLQHGILANAYHAVTAGAPFTVYYHPWTSPTGFIIPFDRYMKADEIFYYTGSRFKMLFEDEEYEKQSFAGTVIGKEDIDPSRWPNSQWRSLKVKWDGEFRVSALPERVSFWEIEPINPIKRNCASIPHPLKRVHPWDASLPFHGLFKGVDNAPQSPSEVLQDQENGAAGINESSTLKPPALSCMAFPPNLAGYQTALGLYNQLPVPAQGPFYLCPGCSISFPGGNIGKSDLPISWCPAHCKSAIDGKAVGSKNLSVPNVNSRSPEPQDGKFLELQDANEVPLAPSSDGTKLLLFGVHIVNGPPELPSPQVAAARELESRRSVPPRSHRSTKEIQA